MCREAATVMLSGQVADGIATIIVGQLVSPIFMPRFDESLELPLVLRTLKLQIANSMWSAMHEQMSKSIDQHSLHIDLITLNCNIKSMLPIIGLHV